MAQAARNISPNEVPGNADSTPGRPELKVLEGGGEGGGPASSRGRISAAPDPESSFYRPGAEPETGRLSALKGRLLGKRRKAVVLATLAAVISAGVIAFLFILPLKIEHIMNNLQKRFFATTENAMSREADRVESTYVKKYLLKGLRACKAHTTVSKDCKAIDPGSNGLYANLFRGWQGRLENNLATKFNIEFRWDPDGNYYLKGPGMNDKGVNLDKFRSSNMTFDEFIDTSPEFNKYGGRNEFRKAFKSTFKEAFQNESFFKRMMYRVKVGRLLETKYGIRRCLIFCKATDKFSDWKDAKGNDVRKWAAQRLQAQRIFGPRAEMIGVIVECVFDENCDPIKKPDEGTIKSKVTQDGCQSECATNGESISKQERTAQQKIDNLVSKYGDRSAVEKIYQDISRKGFLVYLFDNSVDKVARAIFGAKGDSETGEASQKLKRYIPIIGAVFLTDTFLTFVKEGGPKLQKLTYAANSTSAVQMFSIYRTYADEIKSGKVDATMVGSFTDSLGPGTHCNAAEAKCDAPRGGTAQAEETPLYQAIIGSDTGASKMANNGGVLASIFSPLASAATSSASRYTCETQSNKPPSGLLCDNEPLNQAGSIAESLRKFGENDVFKFLQVTVHGIVGKLRAAIQALIKLLIAHVKPLEWVIEKAIQLVVNILKTVGLDKLVSDLIQSVSTWILQLDKSPIGNNMSGGRTFDMVAAGGDVAGNDFGHHGLGGVVLSNQQVVAILNDQQEQEQQRINNESFFARMFDTNSDNSLVTRVAMAMPGHSIDALRSGFASFISNPFTKVMHIISTMFTPRSVYAATSILGQGGAKGDIFGVTQYGYPTDDPIFQQDPEEYWNKYCADGKMTETWNKVAAANLNNNETGNGTYAAENPQGAKVNAPGADPKGTNPCLLLQAFATSAGALYTDKVLSPGDLPSSSTGTTGGTSTVASGSCSATGITYPGQYSRDQLAQIFGNPGTEASHPEMEANLTTVDFLGHSVSVNKLVADCLSAVADEIKASNVSYPLNIIGCYRFDRDNPPANIGLDSYHTYGAACDVNENTNPFVKNTTCDYKGTYDMPQQYIDAFNNHGFKWGGTFCSVKDYMHFEWHGATP